MTPTETPDSIQDWEKNDRFTRAVEWLEFYSRCALTLFMGLASEYWVQCLKTDHQRLKSGRATYWYRTHAR